MTALACESLRIAVHLSGGHGAPTGGTFVATGLLGDSGTTAELDRFPALRSETRTPAVVTGADSLAGADGSIAIAYDGVFRPAAPGLFAGRGNWRVTGGDHAYERLEADGLWVGTARFARPGLTVDLVFEGRGRLR